jgi:hypothetical protein
MAQSLMLSPSAGNRAGESFADAKRAENLSKQIFRVGLAHDFADGVQRTSEFFRDELGRYSLR